MSSLDEKRYRRHMAMWEEILRETRVKVLVRDMNDTENVMSDIERERNDYWIGLNYIWSMLVAYDNKGITLREMLGEIWDELFNLLGFYEPPDVLDEPPENDDLKII